MQRTLYNDGIEVDESDLNNTENTKVAEILLSRLTLGRYGVIEGLAMAVVANTVTVGIGQAMFPNGEIGILTAPVTGAVGAAFGAGVATFIGLRLVEADSDPKPHEVLPITELTRANMDPIVEFFPAADATTAGRLAALAQAISAEVNDTNFVLLGEIVGTGTGITLSTNTQLPRTKGGNQPFNITPKDTGQISNLISLYTPADGDQFPIESAKDEFHRSLIGSGNPSPNNPHGMTLSDIGGDKQLVLHESQAHTNGIIGIQPTGDNFHPDQGSMAYEITGGFSPVVTVQGLQGSDVLIIMGNNFNASAVGNVTIPFNGLTAGFYYIAAKFGTDTALTISAIPKATLDALCPQSNGLTEFPNSALELSSISGNLESKFYVIGLVKWDGISTFLDMSADGTITIPGPNGAFAFSTSFPPSHPLFLPPGTVRIDLRRFGTITNVNVQRRTLHFSRIVPQLVPETDFRLHSGMGPGGVSVVGQGQRANSVNQSAGDNITLKHLTDLDAWLLFNHRGAQGTPNHALAFPDPNNNPNLAGFQSAVDKWRQDNLTMTILKWSDIQAIGTGERAMGDAAATSNGGDTGLQYVFGRSGFITNVFARLGSIVGGSNQLRVFIRVNDVDVQVAVFANSSGSGAIIPFTGVIPIVLANGIVRIGATHTLTGGITPINLSLTAEFHYTS